VRAIWLDLKDGELRLLFFFIFVPQFAAKTYLLIGLKIEGGIYYDTD